MSYSIHATQNGAQRVRDLHAKHMGLPYPPPPAAPQSLYMAYEQMEPMGTRWYYEIPDGTDPRVGPGGHQFLSEEEVTEFQALISSSLPDFPPDWQHEPPPEEEEE